MDRGVKRFSFFVKWRYFHTVSDWIKGWYKKKKRKEAGHIYVWRACQWIKALAEKSSGSSGTKRKGVQIPIPRTLIWIRWTLSPRARTLFFLFIFFFLFIACRYLHDPAWSQVSQVLPLFLIHELNGNKRTWRGQGVTRCACMEMAKWRDSSTPFARSRSR